MNLGKALKIGRSEFELIAKGNYYFVDKTMLVYDFYTNESDIVLITRPKRFGKTLNLSMIEHFFDKLKPESKNLFSHFKISKHKDFCLKHQNKYPVINISLKDIKATNWQDCYEKFKTEIIDLYNKHKYLLESERIDEVEKKRYKQIIFENTSQAKYEYSLKHLSEYLYKHFEKEVIVLVDEYDAPIINAFNNTNKPIKSPDKENKTYYEKVISFMQTLLGKVFKGNPYLEKGLITGVMRVGKESIFSEWNNFSVFGITSPYFADNFGFTQYETEKILRDFGLQEKMGEVKRWYNGYKFGDKNNIYNPWSIVNYISRTKEGFKPYWVNSGDYSLMKSRIKESGIKESVQELIEGKTIDKEIKDNFVFQDFEKNTELFWTLLTDNGYLTLVEKSKYGNYRLKIPNNEVKIAFTDIIMSWLVEEVRLTRDLLIQTSENLINNKIDDFEQCFRQIIGDTLSYFDIAKKNDKQNNAKLVTQEQIYHIYVLGLLTILADDYIIKSNRESGDGRYDIILIPYDKESNGVIIEIKSLEKQKTTENKKVFAQRVNNEIDRALNQIETNKYYKELLVNKVKPENIIKLPIIFAGKTPYVNKIVNL